ncbi:MAG: hypothetical protein RAK22_01965 [Nanoarchaeota archaeon]|nr:hypothetical protein [Nanoarchaeota archaeon]
MVTNEKVSPKLESLLDRIYEHSLFLDGNHSKLNKVYIDYQSLIDNSFKEGKNPGIVRVVTTTDWLRSAGIERSDLSILYEYSGKNDLREVLYIFNSDKLLKGEKNNSVMIFPQKISMYPTNGSDNYLSDDKITIDLYKDETSLRNLDYLFDIMRYLNERDRFYPSLAFREFNISSLKRIDPPHKRPLNPGMVYIPLEFFQQKV